MVVALIVLVPLAAVVSLPILRYTQSDRESLTLNDETRRNVPGQFVRLHDGVTHYEIGGPSGGTPLLLIPGFSTPYNLWDPTFAGLTAAGIRVVRYELFGRGYSDRPTAAYDADFYDRQIVDLLDALGIPVVEPRARPWAVPSPSPSPTAIRSASPRAAIRPRLLDRQAFAVGSAVAAHRHLQHVGGRGARTPRVAVDRFRAPRALSPLPGSLPRADALSRFQPRAARDPAQLHRARRHRRSTANWARAASRCSSSGANSTRTLPSSSALRSGLPCRKRNSTPSTMPHTYLSMSTPR